MNCLLCLKTKENCKNSIFFDSSEWREQNVQYIIEKHLWKLEAANSQSFICQACWQELYNFHELYLKLEKTRSNLKDSVNSVEVPKGVESESQDETSKMSNNNKKVSKPEPEILFILEKNAIEVFEKENEDEPIYPKRITKRNCSGKKSSNDKNNITKNRSRKRCNKETNDGEITKLISNKNSDEMEKKLEMKGTENNAEGIRMQCDKNVDEVNAKLESKIIENDAKQNKMEEDVQINSFKNNNPSSANTADSTQLDKLSNEDKFIAENFQITCEICKIPLDTFSAMLKHYREIHNQRGYVECCGSKFSARVELIDHINIHQNPEYLKCKYCSKTFAKRTCLRIHIKNVHEESRVNCEVCGTSLATESGLKRHMLTHNTKDKMDSCKQCGKSYLSKYSLYNHMRVVHFRNIICHLCGKSILYDFRRHMAEHEGKAPPKVSCKMCDRQFSDLSCLNRHVRAHHPSEGAITEFKCAECPKVFTAAYNLKTHMRKVHDNAYIRKCTLCDKTFKGPVALAEHMSRHKGQPLYVCGFCPRKFYSNGNVHTHRKSCSGNLENV